MKLLGPVVAIILALFLCGAILALTGEDVSLLPRVLKASLFDSYGLGYTLYYATPLVFTGLSVAICFHCGLFNIGAEGQLYLGAIAAVAAGAFLGNLPWPIAIALGILASFAGGAIWGALAGWLKSVRGSHEVIVTILLNFIAFAICDYFILYIAPNPESHNPETLTILSQFQIPTLHKLLGFEGLNNTPVNAAVFLAVLCAGLCQLLLFHTALGFEMRTVGASAGAARVAGISIHKRILLAFALAGGLAGLVGVNEVMGNQHRVILGFSPGYGFTGIAVALLARNHPIGILASSLLFGVLHNSARELEFESEKVTKELAVLLQGVLICFVAAEAFVSKRWRKKRLQKESA